MSYLADIGSDNTTDPPGQWQQPSVSWLLQSVSFKESIKLCLLCDGLNNEIPKHDNDHMVDLRLPKVEYLWLIYSLCRRMYVCMCVCVCLCMHMYVRACLTRVHINKIPLPHVTMIVHIRSLKVIKLLAVKNTEKIFFFSNNRTGKNTSERV